MAHYLWEVDGFYGWLSWVSSFCQLSLYSSTALGYSWSDQNVELSYYEILTSLQLYPIHWTFSRERFQ